MNFSLASSPATLDWRRSFFWLAVAVMCFSAAYTSLTPPAAGLMIFGYAVALTRLGDQPTVRRAFYFGLAAGFLCCASQLFFLFRIFNVAALVLWLVLAFWSGLFTALVGGIHGRFGKKTAAWLIPFVWTGLEYFRSELYFLKFSWLNIGYALPVASLPFTGWGRYGLGFLVLALSSIVIYLRPKISVAALVAFSVAVILGDAIILAEKSNPKLTLVGVQLEFPPVGILPKLLNQALAKHPDAAIFVLSEYTLDGPPPPALTAWCREHSRWLVVGGKDPIGTNDYYNTAFVIGTNGDILCHQGKSVPIQFFHDGRPAPEQKIWNSPWGKIGLCICYDLSYTRVTDELIRQGAQLIICPTMDVEFWGRHQHELHSRVAPVRAAEYGVPIFRVASSGISQAVTGSGQVIAQTATPGTGAIFAAQLGLPECGRVPRDRFLALFCVGLTGLVLGRLLFLHRRDLRQNGK